MNIYIAVEEKKREFYAKLLLGFESALKGNQVYIGNIMPLCEKGIFKPGIIHLKSITPSNKRIAQMKILKKFGFIITSIDEEVGVRDEGYGDLDLRYGYKTVNLIDKLFVHGNFDYKYLIKKFNKYKKKIVISGNPRFDFWRKDFKKFFDKNDMPKKKNYLLLSSNLNYIFSYKSMEDSIMVLKKGGYFKRGSSLKGVKNDKVRSEKVLKTIDEFINIVNKNFKNIPIIIRPHPTENPDKWKKHIGFKKNIEIINTGNLSDWISNALCVIHSGCTSGLEAVVRGKTAISISTKEVIRNHLGSNIPDKVSIRALNKKQIIESISALLKKNLKLDFQRNKKLIQNRIVNIFDRPAYKTINETWQEIGNDALCNKNNNFLIKIKILLKNLLKYFLAKRHQSFKFENLSYKELEVFKKRIVKINPKFKNIRFQIIRYDLVRLYL